MSKCETCGWSAEDVNALTAEIERLTAERDEARANYAAVMRSADSMATGAVIAERDRLLRQDEVHWKTRRTLLKEIEQLRDTLKWAAQELRRAEDSYPGVAYIADTLNAVLSTT